MPLPPIVPGQERTVTRADAKRLIKDTNRQIKVYTSFGWSVTITKKAAYALLKVLPNEEVTLRVGIDHPSLFLLP